MSTSLFSRKYVGLEPYVPGEQPQDRSYLKLNTNESPFPPPQAVTDAILAEAGRLQLYSDPDARQLTQKVAGQFGVLPSQVILTNGSDEVLNFAFMAFADETRPLRFPDLTYGFYTVFARLNGIPYEEMPLREDFTIDLQDYIGCGKTVVIANPNAPTGIALPLAEIEQIVASNPDRVVIVDEAYVDFGAQSAVPLVKKYPNLLVTQTFSKSRSMAGARLGFGIGSEALIAAMQTLRNSTNPYNVNRMTLAAGYAALCEQPYFDACCQEVMSVREQTAAGLRKLGFTVLPSCTNFLFAASDRIDGRQLYLALKARGILVRHFEKPRIRNFNRITIGTGAQMQQLLQAIREILDT